MSKSYWAGRNAGWNRAETVREEGPQWSAVGSPIPSDASSDYVQGYQDGVELSTSGYTAEGSPLAD